jgi:hypothetical protein
VSWANVNELARDGWMLCPMVITRAEPVFVMARQLGAADEAAAVLEREAARSAFGLPRVNMPEQPST